MIHNSPVEMLVETQETLDMKWVQPLIKATTQGEQMKDQQEEYSKTTTMQNYLQ